MDDHRIRQWFRDPQQPQQRRYEILRAFFMDRQPMADLARRFNLTHGSVRNLVSQFRAQCQDGHVPPFSLLRHADDLPAPAATPWPTPTSPPSRTAACSP